MATHRRALLLLLAALAACSRDAGPPAPALPAAAAPVPAPAPPTPPPPAPQWLTTWSTALQKANSGEAPLRLSGLTLRQVVRVSLGGERVRVRLSNLYGNKALKLGAAHLGLHARGPAVQGGSDRVLTFRGARTAVIAAGGQLVSDPVSLSVPALGELVVSLYFPGSTNTLTVHAIAMQTGYLSTQGDWTAAPTLQRPTLTQQWTFLSGIEVEAPAAAATVAALGDSITDGMASTPDANRRFTDVLAGRLLARRGPAPLAVINEGIAGNRLTGVLVGESALARFDRDVLAQPGVRTLLLLEGINDLSLHGREEVTAAQMIAGLRQLVARGRARGLRVILGTLLPFEGTAFSGFYTQAGEMKRQTINQWIRSAGEADGVVDFDLATRDPDHPARLRRDFDSGDHLHPNDAGYRAMAEAIDLSLLDPVATAGSPPPAAPAVDAGP